MDSKAVTILFAACAVSAASAQEINLAEAEKLYEKECMVCHGVVTWKDAKAQTPRGAQQRTQLAVAQRATMHDITGAVAPTPTPIHGQRIAIAPPYGPNLRGVIGRPAGSIEGFQYSPNFLNALKGMIWTEEALDVWLTSTQKWVPGVYMYYSQKDADIRRKIITYLKANK